MSKKKQDFLMPEARILECALLGQFIEQNPTLCGRQAAQAWSKKDYRTLCYIVKDTIKSWISQDEGIAELAYLLNERKNRKNQVFEEQFGCLYHLDEDKEHFEPVEDENGTLENEHILSHLVKGKDIH